MSSDTMRASVLAVVVLAGLAPLGCGGLGDGSVRDAAERFDAALARHDGARACAELTAAARAALVEQERSPCAQAIGGLGLEPGAVTGVDVAVTSAQARLASGRSLFLDRTDAGWRIAAAGCEPAGADEPYDCELEG